MATTQIFAELLIIGLGVVIWMSLFVAAIIGYSINRSVLDISISALTPLLGLMYVFGIMLDRLVFSIFRSLREADSLDVFGNDIIPSIDDRERFLCEHSEALRFMIEYNQSRGRICRSWSINFVMIAIALSTWNVRLHQISLLPFSLLIAIILFLSFFALYIGRKLDKDHYFNVKYTYEYLINTRSN